MARWVHPWGAIVAAAMLLAGGCSKDTAEKSQAAIRNHHLGHLTRVVDQDIEGQRAGIRTAAARLAPGFTVEDPAKRETQMRIALKYVQEPPKGISEFIVSPMSFLAAVDEHGVVIARDATPDRMKGMDMAKAFAPVRASLERGEVGYALGEFKGEGKEPSSWSLVFAAPVMQDGKRIGAVVSGIPLWRLAQQLSRQLRVENAKLVEQGLVIWVYVLKGDRRFHMGPPPELDSALPKATEVWKALRKSPRGITGSFPLYGRTYGYGAVSLPKVGPDVALLVVRAEPPS